MMKYCVCEKHRERFVVKCAFCRAFNIVAWRTEREPSSAEEATSDFSAMKHMLHQANTRTVVVEAACGDHKGENRIVLHHQSCDAGHFGCSMSRIELYERCTFSSEIIGCLRNDAGAVDTD